MANLILYFLQGVDRCSGAGAPMHVCVGCILCVGGRGSPLALGEVGYYHYLIETLPALDQHL